ncbi:hypothetical protein Osc7112_0925 [Oscillatoria nigro-viridis PCC 7112]|uniref:Uncharacterized protein n=1 Tax=Phormidium nigroviride PCC 7112 TaxID=179408 RepID=K9VDC2_9CYAN|nr:hypothetical protein Osc7112_0925 [Oscillatoria nigro-viridis PCC 7112]
MIRGNLSEASNQDLGGEDAHPTGQYQLLVGQASSLQLKVRDAQLKVIVISNKYETLFLHNKHE